MKIHNSKRFCNMNLVGSPPVFRFIVLVMLCWTSAAYGHSVFLEGGTLAGQALSPSQSSIDVRPGQNISGNVFAEAFGSRSIPTVIVPFGYTWTWGDRETDIVTLSGNLPQTASNWNVPINLTAPDSMGTHYILFGLRGEFTMQQVFSGTNWTYGSVVWHDGNDFHDMTDDELAFAHENGNVPWTLLMPTGYVPSQPGVMPIKVNVVPIPGAAWLLISGVIAIVGINKKLWEQLL